MENLQPKINIWDTGSDTGKTNHFVDMFKSFTHIIDQVACYLGPSDKKIGKPV